MELDKRNALQSLYATENVQNELLFAVNNSIYDA